MSFFAELKRRNVVRVGVAYVVASWLLLQVADVLVPILELPDWVPKLVFLLLVIGFVPVLIFAWAFEMTPEGIKRERDVDRSRSIAPVTGRKLDFFIIAVLVVALAYFAWDKFGGTAPPANPMLDKSIAVLPFVNMSADPDNEFFSDGLSEELLNLLAKVDGLKVAARTSSFAFKDTDEDISDIGASLGVATVLEGSVRRAGDRARITAQLIQVDNGFHLWSETYDRSLDDIFAVQDEIAGAIVEALRIPLLGQDAQPLKSTPTTNPQAYDAYLRGRQAASRTEKSAFEAAIRHFERAIELDPDYAPAYSGLADAVQYLADYGDLPQDEALRRSEQAIDKALELDPQSAEAWASKGSMHSIQAQFAPALEALERSLDINANNVWAWIFLGNLYNREDMWRSSMSPYETAYELDPLYELAETRYLYALTKFDEVAGLRRLEALVKEDPTDPSPHELIGDFYYETGQPHLAIEPYVRAHELRPGDTYMGSRNVLAYVALDDRERAEAWLALTRDRGDGTQWVYVALTELVFAYGSAEEYLTLMERAVSRLPSSAQLQGMYGCALTRLQRFEEARTALGDALRLSGFDLDGPTYGGNAEALACLAVAADATGESAGFEESVEGLEQIAEMYSVEAPGAYHEPETRARIAALSGDRIATLEALRDAVANGFWEWWFLESDPEYAAFRNDPLFQTLVRDMRRRAATRQAEVVDPMLDTRANRSPGEGRVH